MKYHKLKILSNKKVEDGVEVPVSGASFLFHEDKIITYHIELGDLPSAEELPPEDPLQEILKEQEKKKLQEDQEFIQKFQIRCGQYLFDQEQGLSSLPVVDERFYETSTSRNMRILFNNFFSKSIQIQEKYKKSKRAYLLHSEPGMGKSAMIRHFCRELLQVDGTAVIQASGDVDFQKLTTVFLKPYEEGVQRIILIIEDFGKRDYANNVSIFNPSCLNFLDGVAGLFRVPTLILCTTNFIKELGPQLTNRPGRFSKLIQVLPPSDDEVFALIQELSGIQLTAPQKRAFQGLQMSPDHVLEALVRHELEGIPLEQAAQEVLQERIGLTNWKT